MSGPSDSTASGSSKKRRRTRVRKSRIRTADSTHNDRDSFPDDDYDDTNDRIVKQPVDDPLLTTEAIRENEQMRKDLHEAEAEDRDGEEHEYKTSIAIEKTKRKRKRTRGKGKKDPAAENANASQGHQQQREKGDGETEERSSDSIVMKAYLEELGTIETSTSVNETTSNSLSYARTYHLDRSSWKFNKAKQEHLIRHMLDVPPDKKGPESREREQAAMEASKGDDDDDEEEEEEEEAEEQDLISPGWPDEWNRCVAKYLSTIQGQAKQRIIDILTKAVEVQIPDEPEVEKAQIEQASDSKDSEGARNPRTLVHKKKSVSFGDVAMAQDAAGTHATEQGTTFSVQERQSLLRKKQRAKILLQEIQHA